MSPSVLYILLWLWAINPSQFGLLNQILTHTIGIAQPVDLLTSAPVALIVGGPPGDQGPGATAGREVGIGDDHLDAHVVVIGVVGCIIPGGTVIP